MHAIVYPLGLFIKSGEATDFVIAIHFGGYQVIIHLDKRPVGNGSLLPGADKTAHLGGMGCPHISFHCIVVNITAIGHAAHQTADGSHSAFCFLRTGFYRHLHCIQISTLIALGCIAVGLQASHQAAHLTCMGCRHGHTCQHLRGDTSLNQTSNHTAHEFLAFGVDADIAAVGTVNAAAPFCTGKAAHIISGTVDTDLLNGAVINASTIHESIEAADIAAAGSRSFRLPFACIRQRCIRFLIRFSIAYDLHIGNRTVGNIRSTISDQTADHGTGSSYLDMADCQILLTPVVTICCQTSNPASGSADFHIVHGQIL